MNRKALLGLTVAAAILASSMTQAVQIGGPIGPIGPRDPDPAVIYTARSYYDIVIIPGTAANNWTPTVIHSSITSTTTEAGCATAFAAHQAYISSHGYIYKNYRTCN